VRKRRSQGGDSLEDLEIIDDLGYSRLQHIKEAEEYKDRIGDRLFNPEGVEPEKRHLIQDDIQRVERIITLPFGEMILDVGCSDGSVTIEIAKKWLPKGIIGVDIVAAAVEEGNERLKELPSSLSDRVRFVTAFIEEIDFPNEYFDTISACEVLEHIGRGQLEIALRSLLRVLKRDGNMIVTVPNRYPAQRYIDEGRDRWNWPTHYRVFSKESLERLLKEYFKEMQFYPLYEGEEPGESIYLICNCRGKIWR